MIPFTKKFRVTAALLAGLLFFSADVSAAATQGYQRIVSLLPSATETLYALGVQDRIAGVTRYCVYPPEATQKPNVGGLVDVNYEAVYNLSPDLVVIETNSRAQVEKFREMGIETFELETRSVDGILASITRLGAKLDRAEEAAKIVQRIKSVIDRVKKSVEGRPKPTVLVTYYRNVGEGVINDVYIAGDHTYYNELIEIAGGTNAYQGTDVITSPIVTPEGILAMNPDIIIELMSMINQTGVTREDVLADWTMLSDLKAYQNHNIHVFNESYTGLPGPRLDLAVKDMWRIIHPEAAAEQL